MKKVKEDILSYLEILTKEFPELRFGQVIYNFICTAGANNDPFYIEDERLLEHLEEKVEEVQAKHREREVKRILAEHPEVIDDLYELIKNKKNI